MAYPPHQAQGEGTVEIQFRAIKLINKDFGGKSDPFFTLSRMDDKGKAVEVPIYKSEVIQDNLNPTWRPFITSVNKICDGDYHQKVILQIFDHDQTTKSDFIGSVEFTLREIMEASQARTSFQIMTKKKAGELFVEKFHLWQENLPK